MPCTLKLRFCPWIKLSLALRIAILAYFIKCNWPVWYKHNSFQCGLSAHPPAKTATFLDLSLGYFCSWVASRPYSALCTGFNLRFSAIGVTLDVFLGATLSGFIVSDGVFSVTTLFPITSFQPLFLQPLSLPSLGAGFFSRLLRCHLFCRPLFARGFTGAGFLRC